MPPHGFLTRLSRLRRRGNASIAHPIANHAVHIAAKTFTLLGNAIAGRGQSVNRYIRVGLITQKMVRVMMRQIHAQDFLTRELFNRGALLLTETARNTRINHHHAIVRDNEPRIDDKTAVLLGKILGFPLNHIGIGRDGLRLHWVLKTVRPHRVAD